jgi:hypothetical protein
MGGELRMLDIGLDISWQAAMYFVVFMVVLWRLRLWLHR